MLALVLSPSALLYTDEQIVPFTYCMFIHRDATCSSSLPMLTPCLRHVFASHFSRVFVIMTDPPNSMTLRAT